jgi:hypothetical protein
MQAGDDKKLLQAYFRALLHNVSISSLQAGDDKKLLQAASRQKKLEERHGMDRNAAGRKFKVRTSKPN